MNVFAKYPQFILNDPRESRKSAYSVSAEFMQSRHKCFFNSEILENKTVLDLGCCVGASGAWVLYNNAKLYCGVEYHEDLCNRAIDNLSAFDNSKWQIVNASIETFLETNKEKYDIIIASGVIYAFFEPIPILKSIASYANVIIIESVHPKNNMDSELESFISYKRQSMLWGTDSEELCFNSAVPSMKFIIEYMKLHGFDCDLSVNQNLKNCLPDVYQKKRFGIKLVKARNEELSAGFLSATTFPSDVNVNNWNIK